LKIQKTNWKFERSGDEIGGRIKKLINEMNHEAAWEDAEKNGFF